jgi:hypothetical protein
MQLTFFRFRYTMQGMIHLVDNPAPVTNGAYQNLAILNGNEMELEIQRDISRTLSLSGPFASQRNTDEAKRQGEPMLANRLSVTAPRSPMSYPCRAAAFGSWPVTAIRSA